METILAQAVKIRLRAVSILEAVGEVNQQNGYQRISNKSYISADSLDPELKVLYAERT